MGMIFTNNTHRENAEKKKLVEKTSALEQQVNNLQEMITALMMSDSDDDSGNVSPADGGDSK